MFFFILGAILQRPPPALGHYKSMSMYYFCVSQSIMEKRIKITRVVLVKHKYICWKSYGRREEGCVNTCALTHYACVRVYAIFLFHLSKPFHITGHILFLQNRTVTTLARGYSYSDVSLISTFLSTCVLT